MPFYHPLKKSQYNSESIDENTRILERLLALRDGLRKEVPQKTHSEKLLLATWNIRDFDKSSFGGRLKESFYYIAEIISHFDIVAIQEVYRDLRALDEVLKILGSGWDYVFSDATEGDQGNDERMAYVYDKSKVRFSGLAGELVLPPLREKVDGKYVYTPVGQVWRTPMLCGFEAGWAKFILGSVHIQWGDSSANSAARKAEIAHVAKFLKKRTEDPTSWARKIILLGDFNIFNIEDETYEALANEGFRYPDHLARFYRDDMGTNTAKSKRHYDQILFREREHGLTVTDGGVFEPFMYVFKEEDEDIYRPMMVKPKKKESDPTEYYKHYSQWKTHQISDHNPLWVEFQIDFAQDYLDRLLTEYREE